MRSIEFTGIPGSGKSTLCNYLLRDEKFIYSTDLVLKKYYNRRNPITKIIYQLLLKNRPTKNFLKRNFYSKEGENKISLFSEDNKLLINQIDKSKSFINQSEEDKNIILLLLDKFIAEFQFCHNCNDEKIVIFEEGFIHKALSLFNGINSKNNQVDDNSIEDVIKYLNLIPHPEILCVIKTSIDKSFNRLKKRGMTNRLKLVDDETIIAYLRRCKHLIPIIKEKISEHHCKIIELDNNNDINFFINEFNQKLSS